MRSRAIIVLAFALICLIWGSTWLVIKIGLQSMPPLFSAGVRFVVAVTILFILIKLRGLSLPSDKVSRWVFLSAGLLSFGIPFALVYWAEQYIASGLSSILFASYPFMIAILSYYVIKEEPLTLLKIIGITLGFIGIIVIFWADIHLTNRYAFLGMVGIVLSAFLQAISVIIIKKYGRTLHPFVVSFGGMLLAAFILLTGSLLFERRSPLTLNVTAVWTVLYLSVFGSVVTFSIYFWLLKRIPVVVLSLSALITPVIAVLLGGIVLSEILTARTYLGATIVLLGVLVTNIEDFWKARLWWI
ncbi:MAG: DMT family transporter [Bacteroidota bacterium]